MKVVITISPGNSGGGAIHDFIKHNTIYQSPFKGHEFRLISDPDGLINLNKNFYQNYTLNNSIDSLDRFKNYTNSLSKLKMMVDKDKKKIFNDDFLLHRDNFLKKIVKTSFPALPQFINVKLDIKKKLLLLLKSKIFNTKKNILSNYQVPIFVNEKTFLKESKIFLKNLICSNINGVKKVILDQSISIWNIEEIFKYFDDVKIIIITRDPRSIFYSMQSRSSNSYPGHDLKKFVIWYKFIIEKFEKKLKYINTNQKILTVNFEKFVLEKNTRSKVLKFINEKEIYNKFDFEKSIYNAFKAKKLLNRNDQKYIEKHLKKGLKW